MLSEVAAVKRAFRDTYGFKPLPGYETSSDPVFPEGVVPDGIYRIKINGVKMKVVIKNGCLHGIKGGGEAR